MASPPEPSPLLRASLTLQVEGAVLRLPSPTRDQRAFLQARIASPHSSLSPWRVWPAVQMRDAKAWGGSEGGESEREGGGEMGGERVFLLWSCADTITASSLTSWPTEALLQLEVRMSSRSEEVIGRASLPLTSLRMREEPMQLELLGSAMGTSLHTRSRAAEALALGKITIRMLPRRVDSLLPSHDAPRHSAATSLLAAPCSLPPFPFCLFVPHSSFLPAPRSLLSSPCYLLSRRGIPPSSPPLSLPLTFSSPTSKCPCDSTRAFCLHCVADAEEATLPHPTWRV